MMAVVPFCSSLMKSKEGCKESDCTGVASVSYLRPMKSLIASFCLISLAAQAGDFVSLFDGKSFAGWSAPEGKAPEAGWVIEDGALHLNGTKGGMLLSEKEYTSFDLEWEWKIEEGGGSWSRRSDVRNDFQQPAFLADE